MAPLNLAPASASREERAGPVVAAVPYAGRAGEDGAAVVLDVLVQRVVEAELALQRHELLARVLLVADEEQPRVELTGVRVGAVGERVAAAQDPQAAVLFVRGQPDVRVDRDHQLAVAALGREVRWVELVMTSERCTGGLHPSDDGLLVL